MPGIPAPQTLGTTNERKLTRMHYQVVTRPCTSAGAWDYYPYWSPVRDRDAATRLAAFAAQSGNEAAILQSVTAEMLRQIARGVVDRQDADLLPAIRYLPAAQVAAAWGHQQHGVGTDAQHAWLAPYEAGPNKIQLDGRRLNIEMGSGGDVTQRPDWRSHLSIPCRMDLLRSWMSMRRRLLGGLIGGPRDGESRGVEHDGD